MKDIFMASVGDGLCCGIGIEPDYFIGNYLQCDWGGSSIDKAIDGNQRMFHTLGRSMKNGKLQTIGPEAFLLTHYHADHYRGLVAASKKKQYNRVMWAPNKVFAPGMPKFTSSKDFYKALYCMNAYTLGSDKTSMEYDLLDAIASLGGGSRLGKRYQNNFSFRRLYKGDIFKIANDVYEVAWPPHEINGSVFTKQVKEAIESYEKAKEEDERFRDFAEITESSQGESPLLWQDGDVRYHETQQNFNELNNDKEISVVVQDANKKLRDAANTLSLVVFQPKKLLMMGDASKETYSSIIDYLAGRQSLDFETIIAPHHGTYWGKELYALRGDNVLISNGRKLINKYRHEWGHIGKRVWSTFLNNDIHI